MLAANPSPSTAGSINQARETRPIFSLLRYLLIVFGVSWPFLLASQLGAGSMVSAFSLNCMGMLMVAVGTYALGKRGWGERFADAGWSWGRRRDYVGILALVVLLWLPPVLLNLAMGNVKLPLTISREQLLLAIALPIFTLLPGFGEEFGWRGYLLPRLAHWLSPRRAVLLHTLIWWLWHWPALIGATLQMINADNGSAELPANPLMAVALTLASGALPTLLHGVVFAWIWWRTQSLAVVTVYHALYDGVRDALAITVGANTVGISALASAWPTAVIGLFGLLLLWQGGWQTQTGQQGDIQ